MTAIARRIYVACLASYNCGRLHGAWIDAEQDADAIQAEVSEMLRASPFPNVRVECPDCGGESAGCVLCHGSGKVPSAEEWAIHDFEGFGTIRLSEWQSFETVSALAEALEEHGEAFGIWYANESRDDVDVDAFRDEYQGCFDSVEAYAEQWLDDTGAFSGAPEMLVRYFDFEAYGNDLERGGDIWTERGEDGVHVFNNH